MYANADMHRIMMSYCAGIYAPICLKKAVDALGGVVNQAAVHRTVQALLLSGVCRVFNTLAKEAQGPMFTPVAQVCLPLSHWQRTARRLEGKRTGSGSEACSHYHGCDWTAVTYLALSCRHLAGALLTTPSRMCWIWTSASIWRGAPALCLASWKEVCAWPC